jgi:gluconokinase
MTVIVVVMGVSGAGKSTIGRGLAKRLDAEFLEGDDYHPAANVAKMRRGEPLDDADRRPWLERLAAELSAHAADGKSAVLACSALRRRYRDVLRSGCPQVRFIYLAGTPALIRDR